jgi:hypothetical protein
VVVTAISSDELQWTNGIATGLRADSRAAGQQVAQNLQSDFSSAAMGLFVFPDALAVNFDNFVSGLEGNLSTDRFLPLWGGAAASSKSSMERCRRGAAGINGSGQYLLMVSGLLSNRWTADRTSP